MPEYKQDWYFFQDMSTPFDMGWGKKAEHQLIMDKITTNMNDFQVMNPHTSKEVRIARGQGVAVLIVEPLHLYVKFYWRDGEMTGIAFAWDHSKDSEDLLRCDLAVGYDVMVVLADWSSLRFRDHTFDTQEETPIFAPLLPKSLARYQDAPAKKDDEAIKEATPALSGNIL